MFQWIPYVFVRYTIFLIAGIITGVYLGPVLPLSGLAMGVVCLLFLYFVGFTVLKSPRSRAWLGMLALPFFSFFGYTYLLVYSDQYRPNHLVHLAEEIAFYRAEVVEPAEKKGKTWRVTVWVYEVQLANEWVATHGKSFLYLSVGDEQKLPVYGDHLLVSGTPTELPFPANPYEFNYKRFLTFQNIFHQHFVKEGTWMIFDHTPRSKIMATSYKVRAWAKGVMETYVQGERERDIALALVLGIKEGLDQEIKNSYSAAGAMHVLAVSGLHVGIVYGILLLFFGKLQHHARGKWALAVLSLLILWFYAFVTGLSPSVLRAVTMFSFIVVARATGFTTNIYNTLAASAFILLLYNPFLIMSVGFQLSYMAVFGIVYLHPIIYRSFTFSGWLPDKIWTITCVSLAAQLATFPLGLLYYHQFPTYFLFSNLVVIPAAFLILCLGLGLLAVQAIPWAASLLGWLLKWVIFGVNSSVMFVESLPYSQVKDVFINVPQVWCILFGLLSFLLFFQYRQVRYFYYSFLAVMVFAFAGMWMKWERWGRSEVVFYQVNGVQAVDFIHRGRVNSRIDSSLIHDANRWRFHVYPNRMVAGLSPSPQPIKPPPTRALPFGDLVVFKGVSFLFLHQIPALEHPLEVDYLVLSGNGRWELHDLPMHIRFKNLIIDSSNKYYLAEKWKKEALEKGWTVYSIPHEGAKTLEL
jgi:competence protein ComEC